MGRQKCLMKAIAEQADPQKVLISFQRLASAAKKTISTNIPAALLPALVQLSGTMKRGAQVTSLMFVPPQFHVVRPDIDVFQRAAAKAIAAGEEQSATSASPDASADPSVSATPSVSESPTAGESPSESSSAGPEQSKTKAVSLSAACG
jgi:hypothetical protein